MLPDLEFYAKQYISDSLPDAALSFMRETSLGYENRNRSLKDFILSFFGNSQNLWMWDYKSIESELREIGFQDIRRAQFGDSTDRRFNDVEEKIAGTIVWGLNAGNKVCKEKLAPSSFNYK